MKLISGVWIAFALGCLSFFLFFLKDDLIWQATTCLLVWFIAMIVIPTISLMAIMVLSPLPFVLSSSNWVKHNLEIELIYGFSQMSPLYQLFSCFRDPWSGNWIYVDSPFHYAVESSETNLACIPLFFLLLAILISAFNHAKS